MNINNTENITFDSFGFKETIMKAIQREGYKEPSPIQAKAIPHIMEGRDVVGQAHTGTGKTAAFGLPMIHKLNHKSGIECLVVTPTRELAMQVSEELYRLGREEKVSVLTVYGGQSYTIQINGIKKNPNIVVATPGRLLDLLKKGIFKNFQPHTFILDEADEMLDMGFLEDIKEIFSYIKNEKQTLFFSATMPKPILKLTEDVLNNPVLVSVIDGKSSAVNDSIEECYVVLKDFERSDAVIRLIDSEDIQKIIVFCRTKSEVDQLNTHLISHGYPAGCLHGDMDQKQRKRTIDSFQKGSISILVATDIAARGLDIKNVSHVFNYHIPFEPEAYVHRIGRTGRAGNKGKAITLVTPREYYKLCRFKKVIGGILHPCLVPTSKDLQKMMAQRVLMEIENQEENSLSEYYLDQLLKKDSLENIAVKLLSNVLSKETILGPDQIGFSAKEVERVANDVRDDRSSSKSGGRSSRFGRSYKNRRTDEPRNSSRNRYARKDSEEGGGSSHKKRNRSDRKKNFKK